MDNYLTDSFKDKPSLELPKKSLTIKTTATSSENISKKSAIYSHPEIKLSELAEASIPNKTLTEDNKEEIYIRRKEHEKKEQTKYTLLMFKVPVLDYVFSFCDIGVKLALLTSRNRKVIKILLKWFWLEGGDNDQFCKHVYGRFIVFAKQFKQCKTCSKPKCPNNKEMCEDCLTKKKRLTYNFSVGIIISIIKK